MGNNSYTRINTHTDTNININDSNNHTNSISNNYTISIHSFNTCHHHPSPGELRRNNARHPVHPPPRDEAQRCGRLHLAQGHGPRCLFSSGFDSASWRFRDAVVCD
eukprot:1834032-Alexandrium_andersonii.AAC.1